MASSSGPSKSDIEAVFNRLRAQATNKTCFDCSAKNPTWSSVTYGVFICIDCSAVHRNLGVHLTFVRSTNLDTNWTWIQLRQMQLGGNAKAAQFFRQHNCTTTDAQQKYRSRAAQLYRDKLNTSAQQAIKQHGTTLFLDAHENESNDKTKTEEVDFFADCESDLNDFPLNNSCNASQAAGQKIDPKTEETKTKIENPTQSEEGPSVDFLNSTVPIDAPKSTIGIRKIQPKRGLGARKGGLGATKVQRNFDEIENQANLAQQNKDKVPEKHGNDQDEASTIANVRLAYQNLSLEREEKLKTIDPTKAKQMERLGMGFNVRSNISHSVMNDMQTIAQEPTPKLSIKSYEKETKDNFFDDFSSNTMYRQPLSMDAELNAMGFEKIEPIESRHSNVTSMFNATSPTQQTKSNFGNGNSSTNHSNNSKSSASNKLPYNIYENTDAQKKFGGAKSISSNQFFEQETSSFERSANLSKFQGSNSISSAEYFGDNRNVASNRGMTDYQYSGPDLEDVRESVRQGVTKVAGRLSSLASGVMSSLQDKYGG